MDGEQHSDYIVSVMDMPIPFATLTTDDEHVWNLQLYFWENALEHLQAIKDTDYDQEDGVFEVDACMVVVLAGTSVSQLLGQNVKYTGDRTPEPKRLFDALTRGRDLAALGFADLPNRFAEFIDAYNCIRHFGLSKHDEIRKLDERALCDFMTTAQDVWKLAAQLRGARDMPNAEQFQNTFNVSP